jgi:hypothetical protein
MQPRTVRARFVERSDDQPPLLQLARQQAVPLEVVGQLAPVSLAVSLGGVQSTGM